MSMKRWLYSITYMVVVALVVGVMVMLTLASCATQYVPVPEYHYENHHSTDTVRYIDSVLKERNTIIREVGDMDSALLAELGIKLKNDERAILVLRKELERVLSQQSEKVHDTVIKVDSVRVPYPVERRATKWEQFRQNIFGALIAFLVIVMVYAIFRIRSHLKG